MPIPNTCPEFTSHPHRLADGRYCYTCQASASSEEQGTSALAEALTSFGIPTDVHQTGGFTMCAYIDLREGSYIYANAECAYLYEGQNDEEGDALIFFDDEMTIEGKAEALFHIIIEKNLLEVA